MQKIWEVIDEETGVVRISILADTTVQAVTISNSPNWLDLLTMERISSIISLAKTWLLDNVGTQ